MTRIDSLLAEFAHETATARKHLERLPTDRFEWRPHAKSFTAGQLASHMVDCIRWIEPIFGADELDMDPAAYEPFGARSVDALLETFDGEVAKAKHVMSSAADTSATQPWRLKMHGGVVREAAGGRLSRHDVEPPGPSPRAVLCLSAALDVPVPGSHGPTADERR